MVALPYATVVVALVLSSFKNSKVNRGNRLCISSTRFVSGFEGSTVPDYRCASTESIPLTGNECAAGAFVSFQSDIKRIN